MVQVDALITEHGGDFSVVTVAAVDGILTCVILVCLSGDDNGGTRDWFNSATRLMFNKGGCGAYKIDDFFEMDFDAAGVEVGMGSRIVNQC